MGQSLAKCVNLGPEIPGTSTLKRFYIPYKTLQNRIPQVISTGMAGGISCAA